MPSPIGRLLYHYVGTSDVRAALDYYVGVLQGERVWHFHAFDTDVVAVRLGPGPLVLLAGHRRAPSVLPIYEVDDLRRTMAALHKRGWKPEGDVFGVPNGPCVLFSDPSGNELALLQNDRPAAMEDAYADADSEGAVR